MPSPQSIKIENYFKFWFFYGIFTIIPLEFRIKIEFFAEVPKNIIVGLNYLVKSFNLFFIPDLTSSFYEYYYSKDRMSRSLKLTFKGYPYYKFILL